MTAAPRPPERPFGLTVGIALVLLAGWLSRHGQTAQTTFCAGAGALLMVLALAQPAALVKPRRAWMGFARILGWVNARVVLSLVFLVVMTPVGLMARWFRWDPLRLRDRGTESGWVSYPERHRDPRHYERMF